MGETENVIEITLDDLPRPEPITPEKQRIIDVAKETGNLAVERMRTSTNLIDFLTWHQAALRSSPEGITWMFDPSLGVDISSLTPEYILSDYESERTGDVMKKAAEIVDELKQRIDQLSTEQDHVKVGLKRVRDASGYYTYRALAQFPSDIWISDNVLDRQQGYVSNSQSNPTIVFFDPSNACVEHACDDLYRAHKETNGVFYLPYKNIEEAHRSLISTGGNMYEYQVEKTEQGVIKQNPGNYLLLGLQGGYSNEPSRVRVSDFWNHQRT